MVSEPNWNFLSMLSFSVGTSYFEDTIERLASVNKVVYVKDGFSVGLLTRETSK